MYSKEITVTNQVGLYARPATFFIQKVNAKSLLGVLSLGITKGSNIVISAEGPDEEEAVNALCALIESNFGE